MYLCRSDSDTSDKGRASEHGNASEMLAAYRAKCPVTRWAEARTANEPLPGASHREIKIPILYVGMNGIKWEKVGTYHNLKILNKDGLEIFLVAGF